MNKAHAMQKVPLGVAPHPALLVAATLLPGAVLLLSTGLLYESIAAAAYTLYWSLSMVHNIKTGPPVSHHKARLIFWALPLSVPSLGLILWCAATLLLAVAGAVLDWPRSLWARPTYLLALPLSTAAVMLYLGNVLEDVATEECDAPST